MAVTTGDVRYPAPGTPAAYALSKQAKTALTEHPVQAGVPKRAIAPPKRGGDNGFRSKTVHWPQLRNKREGNRVSLD